MMLAPIARSTVGGGSIATKKRSRESLAAQAGLTSIAEGNTIAEVAVASSVSHAHDTAVILKKYSSFNAIFDSLMGAFMGLFLILPSFISRDFESNSTWAACLLIGVFFVYEGMVLLLRRRARHADFKEGAFLFLSVRSF